MAVLGSAMKYGLYMITLTNWLISRVYWIEPHFEGIGFSPYSLQLLFDYSIFPQLFQNHRIRLTFKWTHFKNIHRWKENEELLEEIKGASNTDTWQNLEMWIQRYLGAIKDGKKVSFLRQPAWVLGGCESLVLSVLGGKRCRLRIRRKDRSLGVSCTNTV